jgi:fructose PTS system EIIBC or EIIC component
VNKTAFLFGAGLIATGNQTVMGMSAAAIPVMPLGQGLATVIRRRLYTDQERETGLAALFMGCFGISEGAIPFAAARPAQVIPANMLGGAVAGAVAGVAGVKDAVPHGGPIVAVLGAVSGVPMFFVAVAIGTVVTALTTVTLVDLGARRRPAAVAATGAAAGTEPASAGAGAAAGAAGTVVPEQTRPAAPAERASTADTTGAIGTTATTEAIEAIEATVATPTTTTPTATETAPTTALSGHLTERTVKVRLEAVDKEDAIREMAALLARSDRVADVDELVAAALRREEEGTTGLGEEIAVPHAKTDAVTAPVVGFARSAAGVEWGSLDGTKARLVFMIAVPEAAAGDEHLRILALLSRKLMDAGFRERLAAAETESAVLGVLGEIG